jgi:hypothetical protein
MIHVRVEAGGKTTEARWSGAEATLGAEPGSTVRREDAGWSPLEAWAWHGGTSLVLVRGDGTSPSTLRVGDSADVGGARVTLVGLLPLIEGERAPAPAEPPVATVPDAKASAAKARAFSNPAFGAELVASLRRAPWFVLSAAIHIAAFLLVTLLLPAPEPLPPEVPRVALLESAVGIDEPVDSSSPVDADEPTPEPPAMPEEEPTPLLHPDDDELPPPAPIPETLEPPDLMEAPPPLFGTSEAASAKVSRPPRPPTPVDPPTAGLDVVNHDPAMAGEQNRRAAAIVLDGVRRGDGVLAKVLKGLKPHDVLVVRGTFDEMEKTLESLNLPYTLRTPQDLDEEYDYGRHRLMFWNCGEFPTRATRGAIAPKVRAFVKSGGYLFTTDWMISNLLVDAFPGVLRTSGRERPLPETILDVRPTQGHERHPLLAGVFLPGTQAKWWIEGSSHDVQVLDDRVETLIESPMLATESFGERSPAVAVTFSHGRGRVLHLLGHYYQKEGSLAGTIAAQRIALNFVRLRLARDDEDLR